MQYRVSLLLTSCGTFLFSFGDFVGIWALFSRFGAIKGWALAEVGLFFGIINIAYAFGEAAARGFEFLSALVKSGDFDRVLVRPRPAALLVAANKFRIDRLARALQGLVILTWSMGSIEISWTAAKVALLLLSMAGGAFLFFGIMVFQSTIVFWTVESLEFMNVLTNGGVETAQYPLSIYHRWFRRFFTFVVPLACVNYFPVHAILERSDPLGSSPIFQWMAPLMGPIFLFAALRVWNFGTRRYVSAGG